MKRYWRAVVSELPPYVPGEQPKWPGLVQLHTNQNPCGRSPQVLPALFVSSPKIA